MNRRAFGQGMAAGVAAILARPASVLAHPESAESPFRLSVMLWTLRPRYSAEQAMELAAQVGYSGVELVDEDQGWSDLDCARVHQRMTKLGLACDALSGIAPGFAEQNAADALVAALAIRMDQAERLGCRRIILLSGKRDPAMPRAAQHAACIQTLMRAADAAGRRGFELLIEPIDAMENPSIYLTRVSEAFEIARAVNRANLQVLYDLYHEARGLPATTGPAQLTSALIAYLRGNMDLLGLVHIADVPGRHAPGTGETAYPAIYRTLQREGYRGWVAMEFLPTGDAAEELQKAGLAARSSAAAAPTSR